MFLVCSCRLSAARLPPTVPVSCGSVLKEKQPMGTERKEVEKFIIGEIGEVAEREGFWGPKIERGKLYISIYWFFEEISIEISVDWRDRYISILFLKLDNQTLPRGYVDAEGKRIRKNFYEIVKEQKWAASGKRLVPRARMYLSKEQMKQAILIEKSNIETFISDIKANWRTLF